jgi:hypothetical protein
MDKCKINLIGGGFQHDVCSSAMNTNKYVEWVKDGSANISIHLDYAINTPTNKSKINFGWFAESSAIIPTIIDQVKNNLDFYKTNFKYIFTHDKRIISIDPEFFKFVVPNALPWIKNKKIYDKTKNVSFIVSNKSFTSGHRFRLSALQKYSDNVDHFGRGFKNELPWVINIDGIEENGKFLALRDYRYSFAFENDDYPSIYCEKLTDCFATGTIPIYWGSPDIENYFDKNGIIFFNENFDIKMLTKEYYFSKMDSIKNNFELSLDLLSSEDYIYINYLK